MGLKKPVHGEFIGCSKVYKNGAITIPKHIQRRIGIKKEDFVMFTRLPLNWILLTKFTVPQIKNLFEYQETMNTEKLNEVITPQFLKNAEDWVVPNDSNQLRSIFCFTPEDSNHRTAIGQPVGAGKVYQSGKLNIPKHLRIELEIESESYIAFFHFSSNTVAFKSIHPANILPFSQHLRDGSIKKVHIEKLSQPFANIILDIEEEGNE